MAYDEQVSFEAEYSQSLDKNESDNNAPSLERQI